MKDRNRLFISMWCLYLIGLGIGVFIGYRSGVKDTQTSAIESGVGRYVITNELTGAMGWEWIKPIKHADTIPEGPIGAIQGLLKYLE